MPSTRRPYWVGLVATGLAGALVWWVAGRRGAPAPVGFTRLGAGDAELFDGRAALASEVSGRGRFRLAPLDERAARQLFVMHDEDFVFDPASYYRYRPRLYERFPWPEHPRGEWARRTNAAGLREDDDLGLAGTDLAILVTGDSHTDGICANEESFTNLLERRLAAGGGHGVVRALNAGVVGYSFYNYLGVLERHADDPPDVFVVAIYGGNDYLEVLRPQHYFRGTSLPPRAHGYWERIEEAKRLSSVALAQGLNQVVYFQQHPEQVEVALEAARVVLGELRRRCAERGIRLLVVYLPPAFEAAWPELERMTRRAMAALELTEADLHVARGLAERSFTELAELGVEVIDMGPEFRAAERPCYWSRDLHIDLLGHELVARRLEEAIVAGAGALEPGAAREPPDGVWEERGAGGALLARGAYRDGLREGLWTSWYPSGGKRSEGSWRAGLREGPWTWWYEDGAPKKAGAYVADRESGEWIEWHRGGRERRRGSWRDGVPAGTWLQWYEDGTLASEGAYLDGREDGRWCSFWPGGAPDTVATWRAGVLHGPCAKWNRAGVLVWEGAHADGERSGRWSFWWPDGTPKAEGEYRAGREEGPWRAWTQEGEPDPTRSGSFVGGELAGGGSGG